MTVYKRVSELLLLICVTDIFICFTQVTSQEDDGIDIEGVLSSGRTTQWTNRPATTKSMKFHCNCPRIYHPVCATNNQTYFNPCYMQCDAGDDNLTVLYVGKCLF